MNFYFISVYVFLGVFALGFLMYLYKIHFWKYARRKQKTLPNAAEDKKYAILVPARDESKVIEGLLNSIKGQSYNQANMHTFVIVSDEKDKTIGICKKYQNTTCYCLPKEIRDSIKSKGATLQAMIKKLHADGEHFDGYFIIDADNVMKPNFIKIMHNAMCAGNDVVVGCRLNKKSTGNWVNLGSTLTWTYINTLNNKCRSENGQNIIVQGSPLLVSKKIVEDFWGGDWPLTSLTEDYEMGYVCSINDFKTYYSEDAQCYDEQPTTYKQSFDQRLRWIKGHNYVDFAYAKEFHAHKSKYNTGIYKYDTQFALMAPIIMILSAILFSIYSFVCAIVFGTMHNPLWLTALLGGIGTFVGFYALMGIWALFALIMDRDKIKPTLSDWFVTFFAVPWFFFSWLPVYVKSFFVKNVQWTKIDHSQKMN